METIRKLTAVKIKKYQEWHFLKFENKKNICHVKRPQMKKKSENGIYLKLENNRMSLFKIPNKCKKIQNIKK